MLYLGSGSLQSISLTVFGDGVSTEFAVDLSQAPFDLSFGGNLPFQVAPNPSFTVVVNGSVDHSFSATYAFKKTVFTVSFNKLIPACTFPTTGTEPGGVVDLSLSWLYTT